MSLLEFNFRQAFFFSIFRIVKDPSTPLRVTNHIISIAQLYSTCPIDLSETYRDRDVFAKFKAYSVCGERFEILFS